LERIRRGGRLKKTNARKGIETETFQVLETWKVYCLKTTNARKGIETSVDDLE